MNGLGEPKLCYVRLSSTELEAASRTAIDLLGLEPVRATADLATFRSDARGYTLALTKHGAEAVGVEVADVDALAERLAAAGFSFREAGADECDARSVRRVLFARDASGNAVELASRPAVSARRFFPPRDAGVLGLRTVALRSTDIARDTAFWTDGVGARVSDWVGDITYLGLGDGYHDIVLYPSTTSGILYQSYRVKDFDALMQSFYYLSERQVKLVHGPGREAATGDWFLRWQAPEGQIYSFVVADGTNKAGMAPRQFDPTPDALCTVGSRCETVPELNLVPT